MRKALNIIISVTKNFGKIKLYYVLSCFTLLLAGCEHRPLLEKNDLHYIRIYLDEHLRNVNFGFYDETKVRPVYKRPQVMRVTLSNPETGVVMGEEYLHESGTDERGNYIHGYIHTSPGTYNLMAYNFDTESTHVRNPKKYKEMEVYTNPVSEDVRNRFHCVRTVEESRSEVVRYEPDHFFVTTMEGVSLDRVIVTDTIWTEKHEYPVAESTVKTYYMQVKVKGAEYVKSAVALISGMAGSVRLYDRVMMPDVTSLFFNLQSDDSNMRNDNKLSVAYANFNTFGKLPEVEGHIDITFEFNTIYETVQVETIRVTDMFETELVKDKQWIIIDKVIEIIPPDDSETDGGLRPGVGEWNQIEGGVTI